MALKLFIVLMTCTALVVECSHFRGGIVQWSPVNSFSFDGQVNNNDYCMQALIYNLFLQCK